LERKVDGLQKQQVVFVLMKILIRDCWLTGNT